METNRFLDKRAVLGIVLVGLGFLILMTNMGWLNFEIHRVLFSFPMLLILIGVVSLNRRGNNGFSYVLIIAGAFLMIPRIFIVPFDYHRIFWPSMLVLLGLLILFRKKKTNNNFFTHDTREFSADYLDEVNIFGGSERKFVTKTFRGGRITSIFGGSSYDMTDCDLAEGKNVLDVVNIFGGTKMIIPADWKIHVEVVSIFGGFADKRKSYMQSVNTSSKELHITGFVIFGGGEIKSF